MSSTARLQIISGDGAPIIKNGRRRRPQIDISFPYPPDLSNGSLVETPETTIDLFLAHIKNGATDVIRLHWTVDTIRLEPRLNRKKEKRRRSL